MYVCVCACACVLIGEADVQAKGKLEAMEADVLALQTASERVRTQLNDAKQAATKLTQKRAVEQGVEFAELEASATALNKELVHAESEAAHQRRMLKEEQTQLAALQKSLTDVEAKRERKRASLATAAADHDALTQELTRLAEHVVSLGQRQEAAEAGVATVGGEQGKHGRTVGRLSRVRVSRCVHRWLVD